MTEFVNRMAAQREVLTAVNEHQRSEELFGLSAAAIHRWVSANQISPTSLEVRLLTAVADALNFLATRSQDQVSSDYERVADEVRSLSARLRAHFGEESLVG